MGTNYYVRASCLDACEHCQGELVHLGKASMGWKFSFRAQTHWSKEDALKEWLKLIRQGVIEDEYGAPQDPDSFIAYVMSKQTDKYCHLVYNGPGITGPDRPFWEKHTAQYDFHCGGFDFSYAEFS